MLLLQLLLQSLPRICVRGTSKFHPITALATLSRHPIELSVQARIEETGVRNSNTRGDPYWNGGSNQISETKCCRRAQAKLHGFFRGTLVNMISLLLHYVVDVEDCSVSEKASTVHT